MPIPESPQTSSTSPSGNSPATIREQVLTETLKHNREQSKASNWAGWMASLLMSRQGQEQLKNQEAESQWARKRLWGYDEPKPGADDMSDKYVMGDNNEETHIHQAAPKPSILGKLAMAAAVATPLTAGVLMAPAIIDAMRPEPAPVVEHVDTDTDTNTQYELQFFED